MREFQADTATVWEDRRQLLEQVRGMASRLVDLADAATDREPDEPDLLEALEPKNQGETESRASDPGENDSTVPTVEDDEPPDGGTGNAASRKQAIKTGRRPS